MFLLHALELFLGDIEKWPSTILNHLFIDEPTPDIVKRVSAFFYGNNMPYNIASYFYEICSEYSGDYATNIMHNYYFIWRRARCSGCVVEFHTAAICGATALGPWLLSL